MILEIYEDSEGLTAIDSKHEQKHLILEQDSKLIATFEGESWNECMTKYHEYMGWEPYKPF